MTIRVDPAVRFPDMPLVAGALAAYLDAHPHEKFSARDFTTHTDKNRGPASGDGVTLMVLGNHLRPITTVDAIIAVMARVDPDRLLLTGGRTQDHWEDGITEAGILHDALAGVFNHRAAVLLEKRATNTAENFTFAVAQFGDELRASREIVILTHQAHTRRSAMTARRHFAEAGIVAPEAFEERVHMRNYNPRLDRLSPNETAILAGEMARMIVYGRAGDVAHSEFEADFLHKMYTRAVEYASNGARPRQFVA